jgi:hypothetical protein
LNKLVGHYGFVKSAIEGIVFIDLRRQFSTVFIGEIINVRVNVAPFTLQGMVIGFSQDSAEVMLW